MSSPQDSGAQRAAKALEGARLLSTRDYEGAIAACTEAIQLDPSSLGARRTRAEALKRLGRESEAAADLKILSDRSVNYEGGDPRHTLCARLAQLGVRARPGGRGKLSEWVIDVADGLINRSFPISKSGRVRVGIFPISHQPQETLIGVWAKTTGKSSTCIGLSCAASEHNAYSLFVSFAPNRAWGVLNMLICIVKESYYSGDYDTY